MIIYFDKIYIFISYILKNKLSPYFKHKKAVQLFIMYIRLYKFFY